MSITTLCSTIFSLDAAAQAQLNGTSPWTLISPGWIPEPDAGRGTMSIIWSCLVTIFACSWTVTHPEFPGTGTWTSSKMAFCVMAVIAPEMVASMALIEYIDVRYRFKAIEKMNKGQWSMSQLFTVYMGGVELEFEDRTELLGFDSDGDFDAMIALNIFQRALQLNILNTESILLNDVRKRTKTNYLVKGLVCVQASWLVAQIIGRAVAKLPITTLEVVTVGYVVCALISYAFWWHKPQDAEVPITVNCRSLTREVFYEQVSEIHDESRRAEWWNGVLLYVITGTFGAVHCTAWNFFFSTSAESVLWRAASILTMVIPFFMMISLNNVGLMDQATVLFPALIVVYIPVRLYLMIEPFVAFRSVPVGIFYTVNWSSWIPHV